MKYLCDTIYVSEHIRFILMKPGELYGQAEIANLRFLRMKDFKKQDLSTSSRNKNEIKRFYLKP